MDKKKDDKLKIQGKKETQRNIANSRTEEEEKSSQSNILISFGLSIKYLCKSIYTDYCSDDYSTNDNSFKRDTSLGVVTTFDLATMASITYIFILEDKGLRHSVEVGFVCQRVSVCDSGEIEDYQWTNAITKMVKEDKSSHNISLKSLEMSKSYSCKSIYTDYCSDNYSTNDNSFKRDTSLGVITTFDSATMASITYIFILEDKWSEHSVEVDLVGQRVQAKSEEETILLERIEEDLKKVGVYPSTVVRSTLHELLTTNGGRSIAQSVKSGSQGRWSLAGDRRYLRRKAPSYPSSLSTAVYTTV